MTDLIEVRVSNLVGEALDWAVAIAECGSVLVYPEGGQYPPAGSVSLNDDDFTLWLNDGERGEESWSPSTDWYQGGLLIDKYHGSVQHFHGLAESGCYSGGPAAAIAWSYGPTALIAFCRGLVHYKLGNTVQVPKELIHVD